MSKTSQRKRDAYAKGYRVGRYGTWDHARGYRFAMGVHHEFDRGRADGKRDRLAAERVAQGWPRRVLAWLKRLVSL